MIIYRMNQYFSFCERTNQVLVSYNTNKGHKFYALKTISEFKRMCSHERLRYTLVEGGGYNEKCKEKRMDITIADIWLNEKGGLDNDKLGVPKGHYSRKIMLDDPSELLRQNNSVFLPTYDYSDMNVVDKWICNWLQTKQFCQTPEKLAPTSEELYNDFMNFSLMNRREFRQKELTLELYKRFPCVKKQRLRRRKIKGQEKTIVDIPKYEDCLASFSKYVQSLGMRIEVPVLQ